MGAKRHGLTLWIVAAALLGVLVIGIAVGLYIFARDAPPPDDADLRVVREEIPDEENAWHYFAQAAEKLTAAASFMEDLGADSLDTVELVMAFEKEFDIDIPDEDAEKMRTVGDAMKYLHEKMS